MKFYYSNWISRSNLTPARSKRVLSIDDVTTALTLGSLWFLALVFPRKLWPMVASTCARFHVGLRKPDIRVATDSLNREGIEITERALAHDLLTGNYLENIETVSEYVGYRNDANVEIKGARYITQELQRGRGVILWHSPFCAAALIEKRAYRRIGLRVTHLRDYAHPYSKTTFGLKFLNPIRTRVEDRCLGSVVWLMPGGAREAMSQMDDVLRQNKILSVTAIGSGKNAIDVPLLGGTLSLARGVPMLAEKTGASVIPTAVTILPGPRYVVEFAPPLKVNSNLSGPQFERAVVSEYARQLAPRLSARPGNWRGWLMAHTWRA